LISGLNIFFFNTLTERSSLQFITLFIPLLSIVVWKLKSKPSFLCETLRLLRGSLCNSYVTKLHKEATELLKETTNPKKKKKSLAYQNNNYFD